MFVPQVAFVDGAGQVSVMATAGICVTVTVKEQVFVPQTLVAEQVTVFVPNGNTVPLAGTQPTSVPPETVGFANATAALLPQMFVVRAAGQVRVAAGICVTVTLKEQVLEPQAFVAVQVTMFVPRGNALPLAGRQRSSVPPVTAGLANVAVALVPQVVFVKDAGQVSVTAGICVNVTVKEQAFEPQTLVAVQVTVFVPNGNTLPLAGTQPASVPPVTVGFAYARAELLPQMFVVSAAGQATVGSVITPSAAGVLVTEPDALATTTL